MSLNNINDPEGIKALLDTLRNSQAWADAVESGQAVNPNPTTQPTAAQRVQRLDSFPAPAQRTVDADASAGRDSIRPSSISANGTSHSTPSVADLLSQLRASQSLEPTHDSIEGDRTPERSFPSPPPGLGHTSNSPAPQIASAHAPKPPQDIRSLSFQQALPHVSRLMEDPRVIESLNKMKEEQDKLEKQLWEERENIRTCHEEKVKVAKDKAKMIGVGLSKLEAQSMSDAFRTELRRFDAERVLPAWEGLVRGQQARLEALKVPTMFVTNDAGDTEKQRRVAHVLEDILSTSSPAQ